MKEGSLPLDSRTKTCVWTQLLTELKENELLRMLQ